MRSGPPLAIRSVPALAFTAAAACVAPDPTRTAEQALTQGECLVAEWDGSWPQPSTWTGKAPKPISVDQTFVVIPADPEKKSYLAFQVDVDQGHIAWRTEVSAGKLGDLLSVLAVEVGGLDLMGGTRPPIEYPPGTDWATGIVQHAANTKSGAIGF